MSKNISVKGLVPFGQVDQKTEGLCVLLILGAGRSPASPGHLHGFGL